MVFHRDQSQSVPMIVMVFHRDQNTLNEALVSLDGARGSMPVLLVGGTPNYDPGWCGHHRCIQSPPVPTALLERAISSDLLKESWETLFAMKAFLKTNRKSMILLQDDVIVIDLYNIPENDLTCLRVGKEKCDMVGYKMKRWVVEQFVKRLKLEMHYKPINMILGDLTLDMNIMPNRIGKVQKVRQII